MGIRAVMYVGGAHTQNPGHSINSALVQTQTAPKEHTTSEWYNFRVYMPPPSVDYHCQTYAWLPFRLQMKTVSDPGQRVRCPPGCGCCTALELLLHLFNSQIIRVHAGSCGFWPARWGRAGSPIITNWGLFTITQRKPRPHQRQRQTLLLWATLSD